MRLTRPACAIPRPLTSSHSLFAMKMALIACQIYRNTIIYKMFGMEKIKGVYVINASIGSSHTSYQL